MQLMGLHGHVDAGARRRGPWRRPRRSRTPRRDRPSMPLRRRDSESLDHRSPMSAHWCCTGLGTRPAADRTGTRSRTYPTVSSRASVAHASSCAAHSTVATPTSRSMDVGPADTGRRCGDVRDVGLRGVADGAKRLHRHFRPPGVDEVQASNAALLGTHDVMRAALPVVDEALVAAEEAVRHGGVRTRSRRHGLPGPASCCHPERHVRCALDHWSPRPRPRRP